MQLSLPNTLTVQCPSSLGDALALTLRDIRETLHRSGRLSSRHEALDEITKLLFAHLMSIITGGPGISHTIIPPGCQPAPALRSFVADNFKTHLPQSLTHEIQCDDFTLRLKPSENSFVLELFECFRHINSPQMLSQIREIGDIDILNDTFGQFLADSFIDEKELGQYLTPAEIVRFMVQLGLGSLDLSDAQAFRDPRRCTEVGLIIDPSCGVGSFLVEALRSLYTSIRKNYSEDIISSWIRSMMTSVIVGIDKSERMIKLALTNLALFGIPSANLHLTNALVRSGPDAEVTDHLRGRAKLILTNPPFGASFDSRNVSTYKIATTWSRRFPKTVYSEILFMERYIEWLAPGGVLVAIVPDSILTNRGIFADLRQGLSSSIQILSVISLPNITFGAAGTNTKTSVIHLKKRDVSNSSPCHTYFAVCNNVGYEVSSRGAQRRKFANGKSDLTHILTEACRIAPPHVGRLVEFSPAEARWDATYHAGLPKSIQTRLSRSEEDQISVRQAASLSYERVNLKESSRGNFEYIEISDVDAQACSMRSKTVRCADAPSRARKLVRSGDVLVSTVRPERRTIGVVPPHLDGAVCSTGLAVLRCIGTDPLVLARLLQSDFANAQILRNNIGIAYPAIDEACLLDVVLPVSRNDLKTIRRHAAKISALQVELRNAGEQFNRNMESVISRWIKV